MCSKSFSTSVRSARVTSWCAFHTTMNSLNSGDAFAPSRSTRTSLAFGLRRVAISRFTVPSLALTHHSGARHPVTSTGAGNKIPTSAITLDAPCSNQSVRWSKHRIPLPACFLPLPAAVAARAACTVLRQLIRDSPQLILPNFLMQPRRIKVTAVRPGEGAEFDADLLKQMNILECCKDACALARNEPRHVHNTGRAIVAGDGKTIAR